MKNTDEDVFNECVRKVGGICLDDVLPDTRDFYNADYLFEDVNVVGELKCLEKDPLSDDAYTDKIQNLYDKWVREGLLPSSNAGKVILNTRDLPENCAVELLGLFKYQLESSYIKKANRQIRETKAHFDIPDAKGLLLLANQGNYTLEPSVILNILHHVFNGGQYSEINQVALFSSTIVSDVAGISQDAYYWMQPIIGDRDAVSACFLKLLSNEWGEAHVKIKNDITSHITISHPEPDFMDGVIHKK